MLEISEILKFQNTIEDIKDILSRSVNKNIGDLNRIVRNLFSDRLDSILIREKNATILFVTVKKNDIVEVFEVERYRERR